MSSIDRPDHPRQLVDRDPAAAADIQDLAVGNEIGHEIAIGGACIVR